MSFSAQFLSSYASTWEFPVNSLTSKTHNIKEKNSSQGQLNRCQKTFSEETKTFIVQKWRLLKLILMTMKNKTIEKREK